MHARGRIIAVTHLTRVQRVHILVALLANGVHIGLSVPGLVHEHSWKGLRVKSWWGVDLTNVRSVVAETRKYTRLNRFYMEVVT